MTVLRCYVADDDMKWLKKASAETGRSIEELAEAAISNSAIQYKVSQPGYGRSHTDVGAGAKP